MTKFKGIAGDLCWFGKRQRNIFRNSLSCGKAASKQIPGSIHQYVTGVSERSQRTHSSKYEEKKASA